VGRVEWGEIRAKPGNRWDWEAMTCAPGDLGDGFFALAMQVFLDGEDAFSAALT